ncbi:hypothetical protein LX32DRAFT_644782 [Colletotrichum zoysiae]|uniref:Uncharacterized protein n=1 Tax=Colletotrichum zoysiae TaxID=1216348 RepID=A0AAD9H808_9PEZI|nr:hypothetical protein LX32DRAFT_644782 [Colletotrichum zoysiae]
MHSIYPLLLLWSLSCTFAAPVTRPKGLRNPQDIYTVLIQGDKYLIFSPYYAQKAHPITTLIFPTDNGKNDQIIVPEAWNALESRHKDGSPRLYLSDIIQAVATRHANKPLTLINRVVIESISNERTLETINDYFRDWKKLHDNPKTKPERLTVKPSDSFWPAFKNTPFFKAANFTFKTSKKTVVSIDIVSDPGKLRPDLWFRMGPGL